MLEFPQKAPAPIEEFGHPSQDDILNEPLFRRASVDFARQNGGSLLTHFIDLAEKQGVITEYSMIMCQRSPTIEYPSPGHYHLDYVPGTPGIMEEQLRMAASGVMVNLHSDPVLPTVRFLTDGVVALDEEQAAQGTYKGVSHYLDENWVAAYWYNPVIAGQVEAGLVRENSLPPNVLHLYDSARFHRPPRFASATATETTPNFRIIARINTPPKDFPHKVEYRDEVVQTPYVYFTPDNEKNPTGWRKHRYEA